MTTIDMRTPEDKAKEKAWDVEYRAQMIYLGGLLIHVWDRQPEGAARDATSAVLDFIDAEIAAKDEALGYDDAGNPA
jgi:hypothetical protein